MPRTLCISYGFKTLHALPQQTLWYYLLHYCIDNIDHNTVLPRKRFTFSISLLVFMFINRRPISSLEWQNQLVLYFSGYFIGKMYSSKCLKAGFYFLYTFDREIYIAPKGIACRSSFFYYETALRLRLWYSLDRNM